MPCEVVVGPLEVAGRWRKELTIGYEWEPDKTGRLAFAEVGTALWQQWGNVWLWTWGITMLLSLAFLIVDPQKSKEGETKEGRTCFITR